MNKDFIIAKKKVANLKAFYCHLIIYILVNLVLFLINIVTAPDTLWCILLLLSWGIGLFIHWMIAFSIGKFGKEWEKRTINEYLLKDWIERDQK